MIKIKKSNINKDMIEEVLKEDEIKSLLNVDIGIKRHLKLKAYLANYKNGMRIKRWLRSVIDELPD